MFGIFHTIRAFPTADHENKAMGGSSKLLPVKNVAELEEHVNNNFPEMLRSHLNPSDYLLAKGYSPTEIAILPYLHNHKLLGNSLYLIFYISTFVCNIKHPVNTLHKFCKIPLT